MNKNIFRVALLALGVLQGVAVWGGTDRPSEYTNMGSILNTRHNFTFRSQSGVDLLAGGPNVGGAAKMADNVTNYGEVCVYCHTPHGANASAAAPLWNRVIPTTTYSTYDTLGSGTVDTTYDMNPGGASLPCLSCHDGQQAIDAIINMPGSGSYNASPDNAWLDTYRTATGQGGGLHSGLNMPPGDTCLSCHAPGTTTNATDLRVFLIGTDLTNDHPVGALYPAATAPVTFWNVPDGSKSVGTGRTTRWFEESGGKPGIMEKNEIRLYDTGQGAEVECASCHDPHGVVAGDGMFNATFLRKANSADRVGVSSTGARTVTQNVTGGTASGLCLTCHAK